MAKKKQLAQIETNNPLLNLIAPIGLTFTKNNINLGENTCKTLGIFRYQPEPEYGWLSRLTNLHSSIVTVTFTPIDNSTFVDSLNRLTSQKKGEEKSATDALTKMRAKEAGESAEKVMSKIDRNGETVGLMSTVVMPMAGDSDYFDKIKRKAEGTIKFLKCKSRGLSTLQEQALKHISPFYTVDPDIEQTLGKVVPLSTFIGGFPFSSSGYNDGTGYRWGRDSSGGLTIIDLWKRGGDRTNSNLVVMGVPGVGKSTVVKDIALSEYMKGTKIIFIDPEREYKETCKNLNGDWINAGGGSNGRINPLQIRPVPRDDDDEEGELLFADEGNGMGDMALYMKSLEIFFSLYIPSLTDMQKAVLKKCLIELYNNFNIYWDTDIKSLKNTDFPIFSDLHKLLTVKAEEREKTRRDLDPNVYSDLALLLEDIAYGSDSFLWNGHTTISTNTRCICLDTHDLQNTNDSIKRTQYYNILQWAWEQMSADRSEKVMLFADEAYLMIDPNVQQSLVFLRNDEKRARKYEAGIGIISHSVIDFLHESIRMYGQAILDVPCYKILMGTDGKNLQETKALYNLTDAEEDLLLSKKRGHALLMIGSKRMHIHFEIPEYRFKYFGTAGGR